MSVKCPTHPICPDKLLFWGFEDCYKYLFKPFLLIYAFSFEGTCPKIVYSLFDHWNLLCYKFGSFFPVRGLNNLVFASGINAVHVQIVPCCYREQQQLPAKPQLLQSHLGLAQ